MTALEEENNIIQRYREEIAKLDDKEKIKQAYGQARIWNRFHFFWAQACTRERYEELNEIFKRIKKEKLNGMEVLL